MHQAEVGDEDEGASTGLLGQSAIESFMQGSRVAANQTVDYSKVRLYCSPDCCATPKEASRARLFPDVSRGSRTIRGHPQSVPGPELRIVHQECQTDRSAQNHLRCEGRDERGTQLSSSNHSPSDFRSGFPTKSRDTGA